MRHKISILSIFLSALLLAGQWVSAKDVKSAREIHIRLGSTAGGAALQVLTRVKPKAHLVSITEQRLVPGPPPRQRCPVLSENHIVVMAFDETGREITRVPLIDPRLIRAEFEGPNGKLTTQILYRKEADFTMTLPGDPPIKYLKIFQPIWTGSEFNLELIGEAEVE